MELSRALYTCQGLALELAKYREKAKIIEIIMNSTISNLQQAMNGIEKDLDIHIEEEVSDETISWLEKELQVEVFKDQKDGTITIKI